MASETDRLSEGQAGKPEGAPKPEKRPRTLIHAIGPVCHAGQHSACAAVSDPYDPDYGRDVWVCACPCHPEERPDAD